MSHYTIRPYAYTDEDAAKLAVMWNESDDQWPGTFTRGVPMTTERVREWMERETGLAILVVDDPTKERIVGYGSLWETHDRENACYVAVLNVHPAYQRKSLARRMLAQMVDQAVELGYHQMTIGTWPANLKSVPLYKKVGFFWVPDTAVFMENFVPLIRQLPAAQRYFQRHDWYTTFQRELLQIEDDQRHGAMKVYRYHWEEDGDSLSVLIDREAKAVTGLETAGFDAYAELDEIEPAHGLRYPIRWRVTNKRDQPVNVSILASGEPGVNLSRQSSFVLAGGAEQIVKGHLTVSPDIKPVKKDRPAPQVKTVLVVGGDVVELGTGIRPRPAIEISVEPEHPVLLPGQPRSVLMQLRNHLDRPLHGVLSLTPEPGLHADWEGLRHDFSLDAQSYAGLPLTVTCERPGCIPLHLGTTFEVDDQQIRSRTERVPLFSLPPGGVVADIGESGEEGQVIVVENEFFRAHCRPEGGRCAVWDKFTNRPISSIREELGPPFVPSELWSKTFDLSLQREQGWIKVYLRAGSNNYAGLSFTKELIFSASPLITWRYRLVNEGAQTYTVQLNPRIWLGNRERARLTLPRAERLVRERAALFSSTHGDVPKKPKGMAERWMAWRVDDFVLGLIWDEDIEEHEWDWSNLRFGRRPVALEPGAVTETSPMYMYGGPGDWPDVRRAWARTSGALPQGMWPGRVRPQTGRKLEFGLEPSPVISLSDQVEVTLRADSLRKQPLDGRIVVEPPTGWRAEPAEFALDALKHEHPLAAKVQLDTRKDRAGAFTGHLRLESGRFDVTEPFTVIRLGDEDVPVHVSEMTHDEQELFVIDNGWSRWHVAPDYHAGVVGWYAGDSDLNQLKCAFPQEGGAVMGWLKPWFGGIRPILMPDQFEQEGWPGKLYQEQFTAEPCERTDKRGVGWKGVILSAQIKRKEFRGLRAEVEYLTTGRGNLLKVVYRLVNETGVYWRVIPGLLTFCQVGGRYDNTTLHGDGLQLKRTPVVTWVAAGTWGAATNPASGQTLVAVKTKPQAWVELSDWGQDGGHLFSFNRVLIPPQGNKETVVFLALTNSLEAARQYAALTGLASAGAI